MDVVFLALSHNKGSSVQWQLLHGLLQNAIYGGRLDNDADTHTLAIYLRQLFSDDVLGINGRVRPLPGSKITVPTSSHRQDYLALVASLPDMDTPALFSLPDNIDRTAQQAASASVLTSLKTMSLRAEAAGGFHRQLWQTQLTPLLRSWDQLMGQAAALKQAYKEMRAAKVDASSTAAISQPPLHQFVSLERTAGAGVVMAIDKSLAALARVLRGQDTLSSGVQTTGGALLKDAVPVAWDVLWEGPESPLDYCRAAVEKALAIETWWQRCSGQGGLLGAGSSMPALELSALFHPSTFLNALRQQASRALSVAMDGLHMVTCWDAARLAGLAGAAPVAAIGGLVAQGAWFDGQRLTSLPADAPSVRLIDKPMYVAWLPKDTPMAYAPNWLDVPLYSTSARSKLLAQVQMPVSGPEEADTWMLSGLALLLQGQ